MMRSGLDYSANGRMTYLLDNSLRLCSTFLVNFTTLPLHRLLVSLPEGITNAGLSTSLSNLLH